MWSIPCSEREEANGWTPIMITKYTAALVSALAEGNIPEGIRNEADLERNFAVPATTRLVKRHAGVRVFFIFNLTTAQPHYLLRLVRGKFRRGEMSRSADTEVGPFPSRGR